MSFVRAMPIIPGLFINRMIVCFQRAMDSIAGVGVRCAGGSGPKGWNPLDC